jgi:hypothetical protein
LPGAPKTDDYVSELIANFSPIKTPTSQCDYYLATTFVDHFVILDLTYPLST